jgi:ATPase subunit of ABC transporter with duplicated ATPase domains
MSASTMEYRIGFVGRNGAGKSTLAKVLAGENLPAGWRVQRSGKIGYLPRFSEQVKT